MIVFNKLTGTWYVYIVSGGIKFRIGDGYDTQLDAQRALAAAKLAFTPRRQRRAA